jgi:hypothetical protein
MLRGLSSMRSILAGFVIAVMLTGGAAATSTTLRAQKKEA